MESKGNIRDRGNNIGKERETNFWKGARYGVQVFIPGGEKYKGLRENTTWFSEPCLCYSRIPRGFLNPAFATVEFHVVFWTLPLLQ